MRAPRNRLRGYTVQIPPFIALALLLYACGGTGGGSPTQNTLPGDGQAAATAAGKVSLPEGSGLHPETLTVLTSVGSTQPDAEGAYEVGLLGTAPQMAFVAKPDGAILLAGWVSPDRAEISARTTAEVLAFFGWGLYLNPSEEAPAAVGELSGMNDLEPLAQAVADAVAGGAGSLAEIAEQVGPTLLDLWNTIAGGSGTPGRRAALSIFVQPGAGQSGIRIDNSRFDTVRIVNHYRRRAVAWVDRVSYKMEPDGPDLPAAEWTRELDVSPVVGVTSVVGSLTDLVRGDVAFAPVSTPDIDVPLMPESAFSTTYRITAAGLGGKGGGDGSDLSSERKTRVQVLMVKSVLLDYVLPVVTNMMVPAIGDKLEQVVKVADASDLLQDVINLVATGAPQIVSKLWAGDVQGAIDAAINFIATSNEGRTRMMQIVAGAIAEFAEEYGQPSVAVTNQFLDTSENILQMVSAVNTLFTGADVALQVVQVNRSRIVETWDLEVFRPNIKITPPRPTVKPGEFVELAVEVQDANAEPDTGFTYRWSVAGELGKLSDGIHYDRAFDSSRDRVKFYPEPGARGPEDVIVEVYKIEETGRTYVGKGKAVMEIMPSSPQLIPARASVAQGEIHQVSVRMIPEWEAWEGGSTLFYAWETSGRFGTLDRSPDALSTGTQATYTAGAGEGVDTIAVEAYARNDQGELRFVGRSEGEVRVEQEPTIVFGSYFTYQELYADAYGNERHATLATVEIPEVAGAQSYRLHGYGGYDPAYFGYDITYSSPFRHDKAQEAPAGTMWQMLSGGWGPASSAENAFNGMESRFGGGWVWEVEVFK